MIAMKKAQQDRYDRQMELAFDSMEEGFATKAAQKDCMSRLNTAFETLRDAIRDEVLHGIHADCRDNDIDHWNELLRDRLDPVELPHNLHQVRDRHIDAIRGYESETGDALAALVEQRAVAKAMPVAPPAPKKVMSDMEKEAIKSVWEVAKAHEAKYLKAIELGHVFNGLPVTANTHVVRNQYGTEFLRTFYYLNGEVTPLQVIIAAASKLAKDQEAAK